MGCGASSGNQISKPDQQQTSSSLSPQSGPRYIRKQLIGQGTYGSVFRCIQSDSNNQYAMKVIKINAKTAEQARRQIALLKNQISTLKKLSHPNIVKYYSFDVSPDLQEVEIVLQLVKNGTVKTYIQKNGALTESVTAELCAKILEALVYLHQMKIIHRDLKCANVLITDDLEPKLTDFGTAKIIVDKDHDDIAKLSASLKGTPYYMAPEVLKRTGHNQSADIWSFGCMTIQMLSGKAPWNGINSKFSQIINYISSGVHPPFPPHITKQCSFFLESCLDPIPTKRLKANQLLKHRFIDRIYKHMRRDSQALTKKSQSRNTILNDFQGINIQIEEMDHNMDSPQDSIIMRKRQISMGDIETEMKSERNQNISRRQKSSKKYSTNKKKDSHFKTPTKHTQKYTHQIQKLQKLQDQISQVSISQQQMPKDYYIVKKALTNLKRNKKAKVIAKTSTTMKNTEQNILNISNSQMLGLNSDFQLRSNTEMTHEQQFISTSIAKAERDQYIEQQKILQKQRYDEKRKWEQQLKEGAQMLKKQFLNRYMFPGR